MQTSVARLSDYPAASTSGLSSCLRILPEALRGFAEYRMVVYSLLLIILMITRPQGLLGSTAPLKAWRKRRKLTAETAGGGPAAAPTSPPTVATQPERPAPGGENLR